MQWNSGQKQGALFISAPVKPVSYRAIPVDDRDIKGAFDCYRALKAGVPLVQIEGLLYQFLKRIIGVPNHAVRLT